MSQKNGVGEKGSKKPDIEDTKNRPIVGLKNQVRAYARECAEKEVVKVVESKDWEAFGEDVMREVLETRLDGVLNDIIAGMIEVRLKLKLGEDK